jgi:D-serine deaminase-like pyridoxal phosphate-dependent protein
VALAKLVDTLPGLDLRGVLSCDGEVQHVVGFKERRGQALANIEANVRTLEAMAAAGLDTGIFSGGGTGTWDICHEIPGFTDADHIPDSDEFGIIAFTG